MTRSIRRVLGLALTLAYGCSPPTEPPPPPSAAEIALLNGDRIVLPDSARVGSRCINAASASRSWSFSTAVYVVESFQPPAGQVTLILVCRNATGEIVATATKNIVGVKPTLSGKFETYNTGLGHLGELIIYVIGSAGTDSVRVSSDGSWSIEISSYNDSMLVFRSPADTQGRFFSWEIPLKREQRAQPLVYTRVPTQWIFPSGWYAGTSRTLSLLWDAFNPNSPDGTLLIGYKDTGMGCWFFNLRTWPARPIPTAIDPSSTAPPDSAAAWQLLTSAEDELGMDMWQPVNFSAIGYSQSFGGGEDWRGILIRVGIKTSADWFGDSRDLNRGLVNLGATWVMQTPNGTVHEMTHVLGMWHAAWPSLMSQGGNTDPAFRIYGARTTSVIQLLYADGDAMRTLGPTAKSGIPGSLMGERRMLNLPGYPPELICDP